MQTHAFALVGYGGMGRWHRQGICRTERVTFAGVYDIDPARMELARQDGIPTLYASFEELLRVPGIGTKSASRIVNARRFGSLDFSHLKKIGVVLKRAGYFITCGGSMMFSAPL